ncbi:MAG: hypothetical protein H6R26_36 [Proteobacteria bacterium]|nr:hypothetical protein [Pseudomonadota bacterium]
MRVIVKIPGPAYPELVAELEQVPARARAERLRVLATIGLTSLKSGHPAICPEVAPHPTLQSNPEGGLRFRKVKERL